MKQLLLIGAIVAALYLGLGQRTPTSPDASAPATGSSTAPQSDALQTAFAQQRSGVQVVGEGRVRKLLSDDNQGSRHQRFLLEMPSGQTLLVAHNIDLAPRVDALSQGDNVAFNGVYEWNAQGGVIHWTHKDPRGQHTAGWLRHRGTTYQ